MPHLALTRLPGSDLELGERTFIERQGIDLARAQDQHAAYREALQQIGFDVVVLDPLAGHPDAVFVEDPLLLLDGVAILTRPAADSRRAEVAASEAMLSSQPQLMDLPVERIEGSARLEGGDVLEVDGVLLVGQSTRTNHAGLKQLAHLCLPYGYRIKAATVEGCLHLKTGCTYLGRDTLVANPDWVDLHRTAGLKIVSVDAREPFGANVVALDGRLLISATHARTAERLRARDFEVVTVDLSEFEKAEAGPTCLSVRTQIVAG
ncbi:MAG: dimethylargininase [Chlamydiales bacterium]|jgi:dimethylargininase